MQLREQIANGTLPPGLQLRQEELATRFNVSRVPVREALKILAGEGTLIHDPRRGFFVAQLSTAEMRQMYRARRLLEHEVLSSVVWPTAAQLRELYTLSDAMTVDAEKRNVTDWSRHHREFHRMIFELSPDKFLVREVMRLWSLTDRYRSLLAHIHLTPKAVDRGEREVVRRLERKDRKRLMEKFDADRAAVEEALADILTTRGV